MRSASMTLVEVAAFDDFENGVAKVTAPDAVPKGGTIKVRNGDGDVKEVSLVGGAAAGDFIYINDINGEWKQARGC